MGNLLNPYRFAATTPAHEELISLATAAGAEALYDPDNPDTWTLRDDGTDMRYAAIADALGNREDWAQATAASQPKQITLSTGRHAMFCDSTAHSIVAEFASVIAQPNTVILVARPTTLTLRNRFLDSGGALSSQQVIGADFSGAEGWSILAGSWVSEVTSTVTLDWHIQQGNYDGANSEIFVDGVSVATGDAGTNGLAGIQHRDTLTEDAELGAVLVFTGLKTNAELSDIRDHFNAKWPIGSAA